MKNLDLIAMYSLLAALVVALIIGICHVMDQPTPLRSADAIAMDNQCGKMPTELQWMECRASYQAGK